MAVVASTMKALRMCALLGGNSYSIVQNNEMIKRVIFLNTRGARFKYDFHRF